MGGGTGERREQVGYTFKKLGLRAQRHDARAEGRCGAAKAFVRIQAIQHVSKGEIWRAEDSVVTA